MLHAAAQLGCVAAFPAIAVWAVRTGGRPRLWLAAALAAIAIACVALALASPHFGNRLAASAGYLSIVKGTLLLYGLTLGLPVLLASLVVGSLGRVTTAAAAQLVAGLVASALGWVVGIVIATYASAALLR